MLPLNFLDVAAFIIFRFLASTFCFLSSIFCFLSFIFCFRCSQHSACCCRLRDVRSCVSALKATRHSQPAKLRQCQGQLGSPEQLQKRLVELGERSMQVVLSMDELHSQNDKVSQLPGGYYMHEHCCLSVRPSVRLSVCLFIRLSACSSVHFRVCWSVLQYLVQ